MHLRVCVLGWLPTMDQTTFYTQVHLGHIGGILCGEESNLIQRLFFVVVVVVLGGGGGGRSSIAKPNIQNAQSVFLTPSLHPQTKFMDKTQ